MKRKKKLNMRAIALFCALSAATLILPIHAVISEMYNESDTYKTANTSEANGKLDQSVTSGISETSGVSEKSTEFLDDESRGYANSTFFEGLGDLIADDTKDNYGNGDSEDINGENEFDDGKYGKDDQTSATQGLAFDMPKENINVSINAVGDCTIGYDETFGYQGRFDQVYESVGYEPAYFFSNVREIFEGGDITVANLEGVFTESSKKADKTFRFKGPPEYAKILEAGGIDAVSIANNHILDYFDKGLSDTKDILSNSDVAFFGYDDYKIFDVNGILVGFAGIHAGAGGWEHRRASINQALETLTRDSDIVVMSIHWGVEGKYQPTGDQRNLARYCIDNGADLIIGHHTHTLQGVETYNDRTIAYSLGNFCFGGNRNPKDKDTMILRQSFEFDNESHELLEIHPPTIIPASLSSVSNRNDYRPTPLEGAEAERVLAKIADGI